MIKEPLIPFVAEVIGITEETPDVKTFKVVGVDGKKPFEHIPGQCAFLSMPGVGEALFSITSSPTNKDFMEFSIKKCGCVTEWLHQIEVGQKVTLRGPYGNGFPVEKDFLGKDLVFIAGGIGLAPLRSVINYVRDNRDRYGRVTVIYGSRSGFVPNFVKEVPLDNSATAVLCGPPIMIKFTLAALQELGFKTDKVYTTLELRMKCAIGKCGRCNVGDKYVCKDGPVFRCDELNELPNEY